MGGFDGNPREAVGPLAVTSLCAVQFVDVMGVTVVVTALPQMVADLGGGPAGATVVVTSYATAFGGLLMVASRLGDRFGHRRVLLRSVTAFVLASVAAGFADSVWTLAASRAAQGAAAAASVPAALRLLTTLVPQGPRRRRAVAGWSAAGAAAGASGFIIGGVATQLVSWRAVFALTAGIGVVLAVAITALVPRSPRSAPAAAVPWTAGLILAASVAALVVGTTLVGEPGRLAIGAVLLGFSLLGGALFALTERTTVERLVPLQASRASTTRWGATASFANTATTSSSVTLATLYLRDELGLSALQAAGLLVSFSVLVVIASSVAPALLRRAGWGRTTAIGLTIVTAGNVLLWATPTPVGIATASAVCGAGIGLASVAATDMGTTVPDDASSAAAGLLNTAAQTGTAIGTAAALLLAALTDTRTAWLTIAALGGITAVTLWRYAPTNPRRTHARATPQPS